MPDLKSIPWEGNRQGTAKIPIIHRQTLGNRLVKMSQVRTVHGVDDHGHFALDIPEPAWPPLSRGPLGFATGRILLCSRQGDHVHCRYKRRRESHFSHPCQHLLSGPGLRPLARAGLEAPDDSGTCYSLSGSSIEPFKGVSDRVKL